MPQRKPPEPPLTDPDIAPSDAQMRAAVSVVAGPVDDDLEEAFRVIADAAEAAPDRFAAAIAATIEDRSGPTGASIVNDAWLSSLVVAGGRIAFSDANLAIAARAPEFADAALELAARVTRRRAFAVLPHGGKRFIAVAAQGAASISWPLPAAAREALALPSATAILVFAPRFGGDLPSLIERSFALTRAEARVCGALFEVDTVEEAAMRLAISPATAREHVRTILRKTGSLRRADLIARITELMAGDYLRSSERTTLLREAFGLTAAEARVADAVALGLTVPEVAQRDGVSAHTVRTQLDAALTKAGAGRAPDLARLVCELCALAAWTSCSEPRRLDQQRLIAATRMIPAPGRRHIAAADYGPAEGMPVLYFPPGYCYRWVRRALVTALNARGFRPLSFDFPDSGLTDAPEAGADHIFDAVADDAARVMTALKLRRTHLFAEFGSAGPAMAFAARYPDLVNEAVLLMPRAPSAEPTFPGPIERVWRGLSASPALAFAAYEALRTGGSSRYLRWIQTRISNAVEADRRAMADQDFVDERIGEMLASGSRSSRGMIALDRGHMTGWPRPAGIGGRRWTIAATEVEPFRSAETTEQQWGWLPAVRFVKLAGAGRLATHTHAREIAGLFGKT
ncbi:MAG: alpha/beta fold hydrolase [Alphaproteobacteria bacterium]|nr:alpha/beta fold hydrolase [Alphaproteobacteria bacterium]